MKERDVLSWKEFLALEARATRSGRGFIENCLRAMDLRGEGAEGETVDSAGVKATASRVDECARKLAYLLHEQKYTIAEGCAAMAYLICVQATKEWLPFLADLVVADLLANLFRGNSDKH